MIPNSSQTYLRRNTVAKKTWQGDAIKMDYLYLKQKLYQLVI